MASPANDPDIPTRLSWAYVDGWEEDSETIREARNRAAELGCPAIGRPAAALLRLLAASVNAQAVVEVGTGAGVSGAALLAGMTPAGVLTSIDVEAEHQRVARETFTALGYDHVRTRLIAGRALDVLPRLSDAAYDIVFVDGDKTEYPAILTPGQAAAARRRSRDLRQRAVERPRRRPGRARPGDGGPARRRLGRAGRRRLDAGPAHDRRRPAGRLPALPQLTLPDRRQ